MASAPTTEVAQATTRPPETPTKHLRPVDSKANGAQAEAGTNAGDRMKAVLAVSAAYAQGLREMQVAYIELVHRSMELMQRTTRDLIRCTSPADVAEFQKEMLRDGMEQMFQGASKILETTNKVADDALRPIQEQLRRAS